VSEPPVTPLQRDHCCRADMLWGTHVHEAVPADQFIKALVDMGFFAGAGSIPGLSVFDHQPSGHRVVYIARTGRVQIRIDPMTGHDDRVGAAHAIYDLIRSAAVAARDVV